MGKILIVEDEADISEVLRNYLEEAGHWTATASDGMEAVAEFSGGEFDLVLLDVMLPRLNGFKVLEFIRRESAVPVIMLTALDDERSQLKGYDLKVDEYVTKPFSAQVLVRKVEAVLRRTGAAASGKQEPLVYGALRLDLAGYRAWEGGRELELTQKEFELLRELLENRGRVLTRGQLLDAVWGMDYFGEERIVDTHIKNLRKKLREEYIQTIRGVGYRIDQVYQKVSQR